MHVNDNVKAILVGVSDYSGYNNTPDLPLSLADVDLMGRALVQGLQVNPFNIWTRSGGDNKGKVTRESFLEGIRMFLQNVKLDDILIFYYSGHGAVRDGRHYLLFSDGALETQSVIDLFSEMKADKRILFLDCCMSGAYALNDSDSPEDISEDRWINELLEGGTAVFASSRAEERSGYGAEIPDSLFTIFLWNAMTNRYYLHHGQLSLDRIRDLVYMEADAWNERHPDRMQHPVFRSSMGGTVTFQVAEYHPYVQQEYFSEQQDYIIAEVKPLHSGIAKRYAVKAILKHDVTENELIRINNEIVNAVRLLEIYNKQADDNKWRGLPANLIFIYYGFSQEDLANGNHQFVTTWADETQDKGHWYRTNAHSKVAGGILINTNASYELLRRITEDNTADKDSVIAETKAIMQQLIEAGEAVIRIYQEYLNGTLLAGEMLRQVSEPCKRIDRLYIAASDLPVPPVGLTKWSLLVSSIAGDMQEFSCALTRMCNCQSTVAIGDMETNLPENKVSVMNEAIIRFHRDLETLQQYEQKEMAHDLNGS